MRVLLLALMLLPFAAAQTVVDLETHTEPAEYFLPMNVRPDEIPPITLFVTGEIQCQPGTEPPIALALNYAGKTIKATVKGESVTYTELGLRDFNITWTHAGNNLYKISQQYEVPIIRDAIPTQNMESSHRWDGVQAEQAGTLRCDPKGYGWNVNDGLFNLTVEGFGDIDSDGFEFPERNDTPAPFGLALLALVALAFKKR